MDREEVKKILHIMCATYPNFKPVDMKETIDIWSMMLEEYAYNDIAMALKKYILTNPSGFAPSISQLVQNLQNSSNEPSEQEIWGMVYKAICNSNYNAQEEYDKLPEVVQRAIGNPANLREWAQMDINDIQTIQQSQFLRSYRAMKESLKTESLLPPSMRIGQQEQLKIGGEVE